MNDQLQKLSALAEQRIANAMAAQSASQAPTIEGVAHMITFAYDLKLLSFERRDVLLCQLRQIVNHRRSQLCKQKNARILGGVQ